MVSNPVSLLSDLVQIESHQDPNQIRDYLTDHVTNAEIHDESGCVVARKGSKDDHPHVVLNSHMDVVPPHLSYKQEDGIIYGRGACDAKGCLTTLISGFERVDPSHGGMTLVISPDEETYSEGLYDFLALEGEVGDFAINGEPTGLDVCDAARGSLKYVVEISGDAAHAGTRQSGRSAVSCAAQAVNRLESMEQMEHPYLGTSSQTVSWISGGPVGELTSQVPDSVELFVNRWSVPPETPEAFADKIQTELSDLACDVDVRYPYRPNRFLESYQLNSDVGTKYINEFSNTIEHVLGDPPEIKPFSVAAESSFLQRYMPVLVFGPGQIADEDGPIAHSPREYLRADKLESAVEIMETFLTQTV